MSAAARMNMQLLAQHVADSHDLIRVQGARGTISRMSMSSSRSGG